MDYQNHYHRFSLISCETDDSESLATPLDASPCIPLATFPIITVVPTESLLDRSHMPVIAGNRRYHDHSEVQTDRHLIQPTTVATLHASNNNNNDNDNNNRRTRSRNFWPRLKQMIRLNSNNNNKPKKEQHDQEQKDDLSNKLSALQISPKSTTNNVEDNKRRRWFDRKQMKKTRIQPS